MKGKQLTLEEVLRLEDGSKVWVEELNEKDSYMSCVHTKEGFMLISDKYGEYSLDDEELIEWANIELYEWIEESNVWSFSKLETPLKENICSFAIQSSFIKKMATEICNLRGIDLTEDNIRLIVEEFS